MKTSIGALLVLVAVGIVQPRATSDISVVSLGGNEVTSEVCRFEAAPNASVPFILINKQYECYKPSSAFLAKLNTARNTDAYRTIFRSACTQEASVLACIADVTAVSTPCLDDVETKMFATVRHFIEESIAVTCANGSEVVATMYGEELKTLGFGSQLMVLSCINGVARKTMYEAETDLPAYTLRRYLAMKQGRSCVAGVAQAANRSAVVFKRFIDALLEISQCINPVTNEVVLCKTLDPELNIQK